MRIKIVNRKKMWSPLKHSSWRGRRFISIFLTGRSIKNGKIIIGNIENLNLHWTDVHFRMISPRKLEGFTWSQLIYELSLKEYHRWRFLPSKRQKYKRRTWKKYIRKLHRHCTVNRSLFRELSEVVYILWQITEFWIENVIGLLRIQLVSVFS